MTERSSLLLFLVSSRVIFPWRNFSNAFFLGSLFFPLHDEKIERRLERKRGKRRASTFTNFIINIMVIFEHLCKRITSYKLRRKIVR